MPENCTVYFHQRRCMSSINMESISPTKCALQPGGSQSSTVPCSVPATEEKSSSVCVCDRSDGGVRSIVVTVAAFLVHMINAAFVQSIGVFFITWQDFFDEGAAAVGWASSLTVFAMLVVGPLAAAFVRRFGCRPVVMFGGFLSTAAVIIASKTTSLNQLIASMVLSGIGMGLTYQPSIIVLRFHCKKRLGLALGVSFSGVGIGIIAFPPLMTVLIDEYGWQGAMLVLAAILAHPCVAGALFKPSALEKMQLRVFRQKARKQHSVIPKGRKNREIMQLSQRTKYEDLTKDREVQVDLEDDLKVPQHKISVEYHNQSVAHIEDDKVSVGGDVDDSGEETLVVRTWTVERADGETSNFCDSSSASDDNFVSESKVKFLEKIETRKRPQRLPVATSEQPVTSDEEVTNLVCDSSTHHSEGQNQDLSTSETLRGKNADTPTCRPVLKHVIGTFHLDLLVTNFRFMSFCVVCCLHGLGFYAAVVYTVSRAVSIKIPKIQAALLVSIFGLSSFLSRLTHGVLIDRGMITPPRFLALALLVDSVSCLFVPLTKSLSTMAIYAVCFGVSSGIANAVLPITAQTYVTLSQAGGSVGLYLFFLGLGEIIGVLVVGGLSDLTGSYDASYYAAGVVNLIGFTIMMLDPPLKRLQDKFDKRRKGKQLDEEIN